MAQLERGRAHCYQHYNGLHSPYGDIDIPGRSIGAYVSTRGDATLYFLDTPSSITARAGWRGCSRLPGSPDCAQPIIKPLARLSRLFANFQVTVHRLILGSILLSLGQ